MNCKKCGAETVEGANFCSACGARLDGKKVCRSCGNLVDENFAYCHFCGACLTKNSIPVAKKKAVKTENGEKPALWSKVFSIINKVSDGVGVLGVLFALIFVFCIGVTAEVGRTEETSNLYYYFSDFFKEINELEVIDPNFRSQYLTSCYVFGIIGLIVAVASIVCVLTFASLAVVTFVRNYLGYTEKSSVKWSILTMVSYLLGAGAFYMLHIAGLEGEIYTEMSGATIAGIILCSLALGITCAGKVVARGKGNFRKNVMIKYALALGAIIFASVVFCLIKNSACAIELLVNANDQKESVEASAPFLLFTGGFIAGFDSELSVLYNASGDQVYLATVLEYADSAFLKLLIYSIVLQTVTLAGFIFAGVALYKNLRNVGENQSSSAVLWWSLAFASAMCALVFAILFDACLSGFIEDIIKMSNEYLTKNMRPGTVLISGSCEVSFARYIVIMVFCGLGFALSIVQSVFNKKAKVEDEAIFEEEARVQLS